MAKGPNAIVAAYQEAVTVLIKPELGAHEHIAGAANILTGNSLFWLHTTGMAAFDRAELELRDVPGLYISMAMQVLHHWALVTAQTKEFALGHVLIHADAVVPVHLRVTASPDPYWDRIEVACLRLVSEALVYPCHGGTHA